MKQILRLVTRESMLAMQQTHLVKQALLQIQPDLNIEIVGLTTEGDKKLEVSLAKIGGKGLFTKELEHAIFEGKGDVAVHSMKDVPMELPIGMTIAAILPREDVRDAFISNHFSSLEQLSIGAKLGTSSLRRQLFIKSVRPDLEVLLLRGNVQTRLRKLDEGQYDAIILAAAGLKRLGLSDRIKQLFSSIDCIPAAGQGAIGLECLENSPWIPLLQQLTDPITQYCVTAERTVARILGASCQVPLGANAQYQEQQLHLRAVLGYPDGHKKFLAQASGQIDQAVQLGKQVAESLLKQGAQELLNQFK